MELAFFYKIFTDHGKYVGSGILGIGILVYFRKNVCNVARKILRTWLGINPNREQELLDKLNEETKQKEILKEGCKEECQEHYDHTIDVVINRTLDLLLSRTGACRAWIFEFKGYDRRIKPLPYRAQSNTYERIAKGRDVTYESDKLQDMPLSAYPEWCRWLAEDMELILEDVNCIKDEDVEMWKTLTDQGILSMFAVLLFDYCEIPIGVVGVDFTQAGLGQLKRKDDRDWFFTKAVTLAGLLTYKNNGTLAEDR